MQRVFGDRNRIDLGSSEFRSFISQGSLYIDKTMFIEHVLQEASNVLLFTRPRRTGKSLNLDMLRTFLDCKQDTKYLFKELYIEDSQVFEKINSYPVIYLNFKELRAENYKDKLNELIQKVTLCYLTDEQTNRWVSRCFEQSAEDTGALRNLIENIHEAYGVKPFVLIDEYDKPLMDNISSSKYDNIRDWLKNIFESALKDNPHLEKGIMVGVTRVSQEGLLSGLNNLDVYDVFRASAFDGDFSLTEEEAVELLGSGQLEAAREWYNNYRVGSKKLYTMYSVLTYIKNGELGNYWGMSGSMEMLIDALTPERTDAITNLIASGSEIETQIERRLSLRLLRNMDIDDDSYYSFAIQTGYLTYEKLADIKTFRVFLPNKELREVWESFILRNVLKNKHRNLREIFKNIAATEEFSHNFQDFVSFQLSSYDIGKELEKTYHVLVFGLILGAGFKCNSNRERGYGRYDLWLEGPEFNVIIEFKKARKDTEDLEDLATAAIAQIDKRKYYAKFPDSKPLYKVGVGCYKSECAVETVLHEFDA